MPPRFEYPDPTPTASNNFFPSLPFPNPQQQQQQQQQQLPPPHLHQQPESSFHTQPHSPTQRASRLAQPHSPLSDSSQNDTPYRPSSPKSSTPSLSKSSPASDKVHRLRKACDACSVRKVKCDESGPPCKSCKALDIPCTFKRPSRRRGPPNRHAEAFKRQHSAAVAQELASPLTSPTSSSAAQEPQWGAGVELLCPLELAQLLLDDYFVYQHPLQPFPHEPWFRAAFQQRADRSDRNFLALTAGMIGTLITSFPRKPRKHIKALGLDALFPSSIGFVRKCQRLCAEARGTGYLEREGLCSVDAATSYYLLLMTGFTYRIREANLYLGECLTILRSLGFHRPNNYSVRYDGSAPAPTGFDHVEQEMGKRLYWTVFVSVRSAKAVNASLANVALYPPSPRHPHPPLPLEVDDACIHPSFISPQPADVVSKIAAFNINVRTYLTIDPLLATDLAWGIDEHLDGERQKRVLERCTHEVRRIAAELPDQFRVWPGPPSRSPSTLSARSYIKAEHAASPEGLNEAVFSAGHDRSPEAEQKRLIGYEIQKANVHTSIISARSYFIDRYASLYAACLTQRVSADDTDAEALSAWAAEIKFAREEIANDLLTVLSSIRPVHMEPNSVSFCMKIRQIASTLLPSRGTPVDSADDDAAPPLAEDPSAAARIERQLSISANTSAAVCLGQFLEILVELERSGSEDGVEGEEAELRRWADLRAAQREFVRMGAAFEN